MSRNSLYATLVMILTAVWLFPRDLFAQEGVDDVDGDDFVELLSDDIPSVELSRIQLLDLVISAGVVAAGVLVAWLVFRGLKWLSRRGRKRASSIDNILLRAVAMPVAIAIAMLSAHAALFRIDEIRRVFDRWEGLWEATIVLAGTWIVASLVKNLLKHYVLPFASRSDTDVDERLIRIIDLVFVYVIWFAGLLIALRSLGIEVTAFLASMGILGLAVALAAQTVLSNVLAGVTLTADPSIEIGNRVEVLGHFGDVERINIHKTVIRTRDNQLVSIPNDVLAKEVVVNWDQPQALTRMELTVGVAYNTDIDLATGVIEEVLDEVKEHQHVSDENPPEVILDSFGDSALEFSIYVWIDSPRRRRLVRNAVNRKIVTRFRDEGITIPFPQRVIHRGDDG